MKMKSSGILFAVAFIGALTARAERATSTQAMSVARAIVASGATMGERLGSTVESVVESQDADAPYFSVKMRGGGTIITSGDTDLDPVVAILPGNEDFKALPANHPLRALLKRDLAYRQRFLEERAKLPIVSVMSVCAGALTKASRGKWEKLLADDETRNRPRLLSMYGLDAEGEEKRYNPEGNPSAITDMRVEPLVSAQWSQSGHGENAYTPGHSVCGCVATATAQIMHKHQWPTNEVPAFVNRCSFDDKYEDYTAREGFYDWANMPGINTSATSEQEAAIGMLTYNCGVAVGMMWTQRSSGAYSTEIPNAYTKFLGYDEALQVADYAGRAELHSEANLRKYVFPCLDAGYPVQIGISDENGGNGHSIVGDGYGFIDDGETKVPYIHINMGWGANSGYNVWYNFPTVPYTATEGGHLNEYAIVTTLTHNIIPQYPDPMTPGKEAFILSGRTLDEEGVPLPDTEVRILNQNGYVVSTVTSQTYGVWGAALGCDGPYTVIAKLEDLNISGELVDVPFVLSANSWGHDIELTNFSVQNMTTGEQYSSLNRAIAEANNDDELQVFTQSVINASCKIDKTVSIVGRDTVPPELRNVAVAPSVRIDVAALGALTFENIDFVKSARNFDSRTLRVEVADGGSIRVDGANGIDEITLHATNSFSFAGSVTNAIYIISKGIQCGLGDVFGFYDGQAAACANYLLNDADDELGGVAVEGAGLLVWGHTDVPEAAASVKLTDDNGESVCYRTVDALMRHLAGDAEIEVVKDAVVLNADVVVDKSLKIFAREAARSFKTGPAAHFKIGDGGSLLVTNVAFIAGTGSTLFEVDGGSLTFEDGAVVSGLKNLKTDIYSGAGAIQLTSGTFTMRSGAAILGCMTAGNGGAIRAIGGKLVLEGGRIQGCSASGISGGGAIYALVPSVTFQVAGEPVVSGNFWNTNGNRRNDNIHLEEYPLLSTPPIEIVDALGAHAQLCLMVDARGGFGEKIGDTIARATGASAYATPEAKALTAHAFVNDADAELMADWSESAGKENELVWVENLLRGEVAPGMDSLAAVRTTDQDGETHLYYDLKDAFQYMKSASVVELMMNGVALAGGATVAYDVTLTTRSDTNEVFALVYDGDSSGSLVVSAGASMTITNLEVACLGTAHQRAIEVDGGRLTLDAGATISGYVGVDSRASSAIVIWNGGEFTLKDGAVIRDCCNTFVDAPQFVNSGAGGAVLLDNATGYFFGGAISNCYALAGGGVALCNESTAFVSGNLIITANHNRAVADAEVLPSDFVVEDNSRLYLDGPLSDTASIGHLAGFRADTNLVAYIADWRNWNFDSLTNSAAKFFNDDSVRVHGFVVTNKLDTALVVWSTAIAKDGSFAYLDAEAQTNVIYHAVAAVPEIEPEPIPPVPVYAEPEPIMFTYIGANSDSTLCTLRFTNAVKWCHYSIYGTNTLQGGFKTDGVQPQTNFQWKSSAKDVEIVLPAGDGVKFWSVVGAPGLIEE